MKTDKTMGNGKSMLPAVLGVFLLLVAIYPLSTVLAATDAYPTKPVRLIINFAPGGSTDTIGRLIGIKLSERLGRPVVTENRAGAGGILGAEAVAKSAPTATRCCSALRPFRSTPCSSRCRTIR